MSEKLNLDVQSIYNKQFAIDFKGYNPAEVDNFIDLMIEDYQTFQDIIDDLNEKNGDLQRNNASLRAKLIEVEGKLRAKEKELSSAVVGGANVDILKRLSRLEEQLASLQDDNDKAAF